MKLGVIGCGNMSKAILRGVLDSEQLSKEQICIIDRSASSTQQAANELGVQASSSLAELVTQSSVILLGVKPQTVTQILSEVSEIDSLFHEKLLISIAAGIGLDTLASNLPENARVIRTMPNTPVLVSEGVLAFSPSQSCSESDEQVIQTLFSSSSTVTKVPESLMDAITGLSGSGPAYVFSFIESLADGAVKEGLPRDQALQLAAQTVLGSAKMVLQTQEHPAVLRDRVSSPGGTTIAGTVAMEANGFRNAVISAVSSATQRSKELG